MLTVTAFQAKTYFSALLEQVEKGAQIAITRHGHPVARLVPIGAVNRAQIKLAIQKILQFNKSHTLGHQNWKDLCDKERR